MYETLGGISGATLGYITYGTRGALAGWNIGKSLGKRKTEKVSQMAPIPPKRRSYRRTNNPYATPFTVGGPSHDTRRMSVSSATSSRRSSRSVVPVRNINSVQGVGAGAVRVQRSRKATRLAKKKKVVTVSKKLRQKIKKVISGQAIKGMTQEISYGVQRLITTADNAQIVTSITTSNAAVGGTNPHFSMAKIMDAASCLWNEKAQVENPKLITDTGNFDNKKLKVKIIDSSVTYNFKNNTMRKVNCRFLEIRPKNLETAGNPIDAWGVALTNQLTGPNQSGINVSELYTNPGMLPDMRNVWNITTTKFEMAPGTEYKHYVQGPKNKLIDFQRNWNGSTFRNYTKDSCFTLLITIPDLVTTDIPEDYGRYQNATADENAKYGIIFEGITRYHMEMPEQVGFQVPAGGVAAGDSVPLSQRQFSYAFKTYGNARAPGAVLVAINDENPIAQVADP